MKMTVQNSEKEDIVDVEYSKGGMMEMMRTGVYPKYLCFYSHKFKRRWEHKVKGGAKKGNLKNKGEIIYQYSFDEENGCKVVDIHGYDVTGSMSYLMCD